MRIVTKRHFIARRNAAKPRSLQFSRLGFEALEERALLHGGAISGGLENGDLESATHIHAAVAISAGHVGSSPFAPPEANDHAFVVDQGGSLDTGCTYKSGGPLVFSILVDRVVGDVSKLLANDLISPQAHLKLPAFDVDFDGEPPPERDRVTFNGHVVPTEFLTGSNNVWKLNNFDIPIEWINFPSDASSPASNTISIDIDTLSTSERWCTEIDWASLTVDKIAPPVLFVHGILSDSSGWDSPWRSNLDALGVPNDAIDLGNNQGLLILDSIGQNSADIAARVASLQAKWGVDQLNIVAHSKGGIDSRDFIEGSDTVHRLIQLGTPNAGSPLADLIERGVVGLTSVLGAAAINALVGPAGIQLTTPYMAGYNAFHGLNPETEYTALAGNYKFGGFFGTIGDIALLGIMGGDSDTIVPVWSVHSLAGANDLTFSSSGSATDAMHTGMVQSSAIYNLLYGAATEPVPALSASRLQMQAPSGAFVETGTAAGVVSQGQTVSQSIIVDGSGRIQFTLLHTMGGLGFSLTSPSGRIITATTPATDPNVKFGQLPAESGIKGSIYELSGSRAEFGQWTVNVLGSSVTNPAGQEPFFISAWAESSTISMDATLNQSGYHGGDPITISATLRDNGSPILGASVKADVVFPDNTTTSVILVDNGSGGDLAAGDGIYAGILSDTSKVGFYELSVDALGPSSKPFEREQLLVTTVSSSRSLVSGSITDAGVDLNGNSLFDQLKVDTQFNVTNAATYRFSATLKSSDGTIIDQSFLEAALTPGLHAVSLPFDGATIFKSGKDGPYTVSLGISEVNPLGLLPLTLPSDVHQTAVYSHLQFEHPGIFSLATGSDMGVDLNTNSLFDELHVNIDLNIATAGDYQWSARLEDINGTEIGFASDSGQLTAGNTSVDLVFDGRLIGENGVNGPYFVKDLLIFSGTQSADIPDPYVTSAYLASAFEGSNVPPVLQIAGASKGVRGQALSFTFTTSDADPADEAAGFAYAIDWGDAQTQNVSQNAGNNALAITHIYTTAGNYTITAIVTDQNNAASLPATANVQIAAVTLLPDAADPGKTNLYIGGTTGNDAIRVERAKNNKLEVFINNRSQGAFNPSGRIYVYAQAGNDNVKLSDKINLSAFIDGGIGDDTIHGSRGNDILIGGPGRDSLYGDGGMDLLIGGLNEDRLFGNGNQDIIVAGTTSFDNNEAALLAIMAEWSANRSYAQRKKNLQGVGSGTRANGSVFLQSDGASATVFDDLAIDRTSIRGRDWVFATFTGKFKDKRNLD